MSHSFINQHTVQDLLRESAGLNSTDGNERFKSIIHRLLTNICTLIDDYNVTQEEFWHAVNYLHELGGRKEAALLAAGLGLEHFLDLRQEAIEASQSSETGTPRTIEGPLYVANAPLADGHDRMDDGLDDGEVMWLYGEVKDVQGHPVAGAIVDIWHANTLGNYSFFDPSQSEYNLRRRIRTDAEGRYSVRSILPSGYGCPPDGPTQALLDRLGRHGNRPAHIHFFVSAPGFKHLTSQINLNGDRYLWDDFAFATRDGLIADPVKVTDPALIAQRQLAGEHTEVRFDFTLCKAQRAEEEQRITRLRALE
ncbi:catechol 1,2-dioxygenase [Citrobacter sp. Cs237]|uniref:catechol 1,2-dioxygenase n=1 Tax=Citrobacter TaxID=544 RepID=UPI0005A83F44|nr:MULTISPECIES: catechol 1,2-dioxygenase [Citrobacter]EHG7580053.1 catechol 1,2-dioxygenase [Citrobacter sedlakii]EHG7611604.1 catechol 1,2-dioxygenase [Citrobacter sedlakii]EIQ7156290.1 catechol 1,2-dioxygenase [Citrobacter sedlakii]MBN6598055.1 catechol 1,2-dioxygenase [Citrobacter sedlakii]MDM2751641.1 catechol 1,2-dioxygenase [Citrobacter sp. Cs237]